MLQGLEINSLSNCRDKYKKDQFLQIFPYLLLQMIQTNCRVNKFSFLIIYYILLDLDPFFLQLIDFIWKLVTKMTNYFS